MMDYYSHGFQNIKKNDYNIVERKRGRPTMKKGNEKR